MDLVPILEAEQQRCVQVGDWRDKVPKYLRNQEASGQAPIYNCFLLGTSKCRMHLLVRVSTPCKYHMKMQRDGRASFEEKVCLKMSRMQNLTWVYLLVR